MKAKLSKKLLSIGLSVLMAVSVLPLSLISTNAVTCNIKPTHDLTQNLIIILNTAVI